VVCYAVTFVPGLMKIDKLVEKLKLGNMSRQRSDVIRRHFFFTLVRQSKGQGRPYTVAKAYRGRGGTVPLIRDLRTIKRSSKLQLKISVTPGHKSDKHVNTTSFFHIRGRLTTQDPIQILHLKTIISILVFQNENNFTNS
jgi:hypothetical protein